MLLECTKKLLDYAQIKPAAVMPPDALFEWSAGLVTVNRRKTIVVTNVATRCCFVLHGVNTKELKKLDELLIEGVRTLLESEHIKPEIIEKYLDELGREVIYSKNLSRIASARCAKAVEHVEYFGDYFIPGDMFQKSKLTILNNDLFTVEKKYMFAYEMLRNKLKERYGDNIFSREMLEIRVKLQGLSCERILIVPSDFDFALFHKVLQAAFGWHDEHLHQFVLETDEYGRPTKIIEPTELDDEFDIDLPGLPELEKIDSSDVTLGEIFGKYKKMVYEYDFGDDWIHEIELKKVISNSPDPEAHCIKAKGDAPMEDSGGVEGFKEIQRIMKNPDDPEYEDTMEWVKSMWWNHVDQESIDRKVRHIERGW